jgi:hypothetical protein
MSVSEDIIYRYWGKAKRPLEVDCCANVLTDEEILEKHNITKEELLKKKQINCWAKVAKGKPYVAYHLLPYHCLDVAAVGKILLEKNPCWPMSGPARLIRLFFENLLITHLKP